MLALEDMAGMNENEIKEHLADEYAGAESGFDYGYPTDDDKSKMLKELDKWDILVAYESVGSWGCDSSSFFLLKNKIDKSYGMISGSHCSCYGFEGQGEIDPVEIEYLNSEKFYFSTGGYDDNAEKNTAAVKDFMKKLGGDA